MYRQPSSKLPRKSHRHSTILDRKHNLQAIPPLALTATATVPALPHTQHPRPRTEFPYAPHPQAPNISFITPLPRTILITALIFLTTNFTKTSLLPPRPLAFLAATISSTA
ncbi:hypothetical protein E4U58_002123, partial [Claviceps cyperi]